MSDPDLRERRISELQALIKAALAIADDLKLHDAGIRLDQARLVVEADYKRGEQ